MKKFIILLLVISFTALEAQDYQYFTAKQGIPKAMEIAKQYFQSDSVELYSIKCVRWEIVLDNDTHYSTISILDSINPYDSSTGKSLFWYYEICDSNDSCCSFRFWNDSGVYKVDSIFNCSKSKLEGYPPLYEKDILIDTDSLVKCLEKNWADIINFSTLWISKNGYPFDSVDLPIWEYHWRDITSTSGVDAYINTKTCEFYQLVLNVSKKYNNINSPITITSDLNTDNITIETNSDMFQDAELRLYDQIGVMHFADIIRDKKYNLNTYKVPSGLYILQIKYGGNIYAKTVMVVH